VPGYPRHVKGRQNIIDLYSNYDDYMTVHTADNLRVYRDPEASVVVLEYEVHGESVQTGQSYNPSVLRPSGSSQLKRSMPYPASWRVYTACAGALTPRSRNAAIVIAPA
jgi:hypothetical protein